ncbi:MAG TPA: amidohydrolase [Clostridiaceae bacterium]|nr:amidohydrolase [Clostridiaceae bacterium]
MDHTSLIVHNCILVTVDQEDHIFEDGMLVIEGDTIQYAGPKVEPLPPGKQLNMRGKIVLPGLINTHTHSPASLFRGFGDDLFLMDWLHNYMWPVERHMTAEDAYHGSRLSYLEYLRHGMTTNVDMWYFSESVALAAQSIGLRSLVAAGVFSWPTPESSDSLHCASEFIEKYYDKSNETLVYPCYGPHDAYSCSQELLREIAHLSETYNTLIVHAHLSETVENNEEILEKYGVTPTRYFEQTGVFERRFLGAHCIWLTDEDMSIFHEHDASVSYNPVSNLKLCDGILPARRLLDAGVRITLGIDGAQSNNSLDLLADQKTGVLIQKMKEKDPTFFPARQAVRMVTIDAADSIGMGHAIGSIEVGKKADIISLDTNDLNLTPLQDNMRDMVYSHITYSATGANVSDVFVNGRQLMQDKVILGINVEEIRQEAQKASDRLHRIRQSNGG